jgi:hypothetical protein
LVNPSAHRWNFCDGQGPLPEELCSAATATECNVVQFWREPVIAFRRLNNQLSPGGRLVTGFEPRNRGAREEDALRMGKRMKAWLGEAGFTSVELAVKLMKPVSTICALATVKAVSS